MRLAALLGSAGVVTLAVGAGILMIGDTEAQAPAAPRARYVMDASTTTSNLGGGAMAMLAGRGGDAEAHDLTLRLGTSIAPSGGPAKADHFMPAGANLGPSVPLATPTPSTHPDAYPGTTAPDDPRPPKGRLLIFWGCGAHAGPGQPVVVDFAKMVAGQMAGLSSNSVPADTGPTQANSRTYGSWPNALDARARRTKVGSLVGEHRIAGNYSPEISFALAQDFLPGLRVTSALQEDGSTQMSWNAVPAATGYYAWISGSKPAADGAADMVWWASSARQEFGGALWDYVAPAAVARLIGQKVVMPPSQTSCTVPAEVRAAAGPTMMAFLYGYGPEQDFAYPPRQASAKAAWRPEWTAKVRYRSMATVMLGMPAAMGREAANAGDAPADKPRKCKKKLGLGGLLGTALGVPTGC